MFKRVYVNSVFHSVNLNTNYIKKLPINGSSAISWLNLKSI